MTAAVVALADETGLCSYQQIADILGISWLDVPQLILEVPTI
ncbi:MAG: hypothetical protein REI11_11600 [Patulibacter sp.]|nr:hypothetical protein [Patulibacter sp.]